MADVIPLKALYAVGGEPEAFAEVASGDTLRAPDGGVKFPDGTIQITAPGYPVEGPVGPQGPEGPTVVSADAGNVAFLGTDGFIYVSATPTDELIGRVEAIEIQMAELLPWCWPDGLPAKDTRATTLPELEARVAELEAQMAALLPWSRL